MSAAHGGQTVVSSATRSLVAGGDGLLQDLGEHRLKDLSEPEHVWQLIEEGLTAEFPPLRTLDAVPGNLPVDPATFIGREDDIERLMTTLEGHRVVTMTGVGGVGKSRLSLQVAADASHHYPHGIWFVELAPVRVADAVPFRFLETLELEAVPGSSPVETVAAAVGDDSVLVVVDNCEHVIEAAGRAVGELVANCPNLKVLASSRRALGVSGEQVRPIRPLDTSGARSAATHLFVDRSMAAGNEADLTDRLDVVTEICARLDGVPLAIELAAARTRSMSPEDLSERLDERFRLLKGSRSSDADERHKTLLSTIEWSYDLLDEDQQLLLQRLSVFSGSFTLAAAERVCADERLDEFDVVDLIAELIDHSMLVADTGGASTRYRMLETIREFARQKLGDDLGALRDRHAEFHAQWVEGIWARVFTTDEPDAVRELDQGWSDLRAAAVHATGDLRLLSRILRHLAFDAFYRARFEVGDWARAGLTVGDLEGVDDEDRAVFLAAAASIGGLAGDAERATQLGAELTRLCADGATTVPPDVAGAAVGSMLLAGDLDLADRVTQLAERAAEEAGDRWVPTVVTGYRALVATYSAQPDIAADALAACFAGMPADYSPTLRATAGWISAMNSDAPRTEVVAQMEEVLDLAEQVKSSPLQSIYVQYLSSLRAEVGDLAQPMVDAADNLEQMLASRNLGLVTAQIRRAAVILIKAGHHAVAARLLGWIDGLELSNPITGDLLAEIEVLVPQMRDALGADAEQEATAGAALSLEDAIALAISTLRSAADALGS
jgi:predicted ATPase